MNYEIYGLCDPETGRIHYIGQSNNAGRRLKEHMRSPAENVQPWIWQLGESGLRPRLVILETCPKEDKDSAEKWWLHWAVRKNQPILNTNDIPGWYREMNRAVEPCPYCGMFCGWTLRGGCNLGDKSIHIVSVQKFNRQGADGPEHHVPMAMCHMCEEVGPIKKRDYHCGPVAVVKCSQCKRWCCRLCGPCDCVGHNIRLSDGKSIAPMSAETFLEQFGYKPRWETTE